MRFITWIVVMLFSHAAFSLTPDLAISMVPRGKLENQTGRDFVIKTVAGTKIGIEFERNGKFEEANGNNLNKGDELEPGDGLISLSSAAQTLVTKGISPQGHWVLDKDDKLGWVYEFENTLVDARTGKVINELSLQHLTKAARTE
jgi:hypothetical protein